MLRGKKEKTMTKDKVTIMLLLLILLAACQKEKGLQSQPAPAAPPQAEKQPSAMEIAGVLKAAGIPFLSEYNGVQFPIDGSPGTSVSMLAVNNPGGILTEATTATANADISIIVFSSREKLKEAQKRVEAMDHRTQRDKDLNLGLTAYEVYVGCINVTLTPDKGKPNKTVSQYAEAIKKILKQKYGD